MSILAHAVPSFCVLGTEPVLFKHLEHEGAWGVWLEPRPPLREVYTAQQVYKFPDSVTIFLHTYVYGS